MKTIERGKGEGSEENKFGNSMKKALERKTGDGINTFPTPPSPKTTSLYIVILPAMMIFVDSTRVR